MDLNNRLSLYTGKESIIYYELAIQDLLGIDHQFYEVHFYHVLEKNIMLLPILDR